MSVIKDYTIKLSKSAFGTSTLSQLLKSESYNNTVFSLVPKELCSIMQHYYEYLVVEGSYDTPKAIPFKLNYYICDKVGTEPRILESNELTQDRLYSLPTKQIAMLRFNLCGMFQIKPFKINLWVNTKTNSYLVTQEFPIMKDGWGLITNDRHWISSRCHEIWMFTDTDVLIELQDSCKEIWRFSGLPVEEYRR